MATCSTSSSFLARSSYDCVAPYVDIIFHKGRFWAKSAASGSVRWCCFRSCWMVLSHVIRGRPSCLLQSAGGEANRILLASVLSSMRIICPNRISRRDWINAVDQIQMCIVLLIVLHSLVTPVLCVTCKLPATLITKQVWLSSFLTAHQHITGHCVPLMFYGEIRKRHKTDV